MITNYLAAESLIIARLKAQVPTFRAVYGAADLAGVEERAQVTPAAHVIYDGDAVPGGEVNRAGAGAAQVVAQHWLVVVAVRNVRDTQGGQYTREEAGPLVSQTITALSGWKPSTDFRPLRRTSAPKPAFTNGFGYFPLMFEALLITA
jgi:hypothetical protein